MTTLVLAAAIALQNPTNAVPRGAERTTGAAVMARRRSAPRTPELAFYQFVSGRRVQMPKDLRKPPYRKRAPERKERRPRR